jgi:hypothetical protein
VAQRAGRPLEKLDRRAQSKVGSLFCNPGHSSLPLVAAYIAKLFWPLQQFAFAAFSFLGCYRPIGETIDDMSSEIGCLLIFPLGRNARALGARTFSGPTFIFPTLDRTLAGLLCALWALVHRHTLYDALIRRRQLGPKSRDSSAVSCVLATGSVSTRDWYSAQSAVGAYLRIIDGTF